MLALKKHAPWFCDALPVDVHDAVPTPSEVERSVTAFRAQVVNDGLEASFLAPLCEASRHAATARLPIQVLRLVHRDGSKTGIVEAACTCSTNACSSVPRSTSSDCSGGSDSRQNVETQRKSERDGDVRHLGQVPASVSMFSKVNTV